MKTIALIIALCFTANSIAGLPPTTLRGQNQSSVTTFNFQVPNNQATKTTTGTLNETGNTNILSNPSGEGSSTSPWNLTNGSLAIETSVVVHGAQSLKATLSAQELELFNSSTLYAAQFADGVNGALSIRVKTSLSTIFVCPSQNSTTNYNLCLPVDSSNKWLSYKVPFVFGSGNQGLVLVSGSISSGVFTPGNVTGDVYVDDAFVGTDEGSVASIITPWAAYTPTVSGLGTVTAQAFYWRQNGNSIEVEGSWTNGTVSGSTASITLPNSYTIDSSKLSRTNTTANAGPIIGSYTAAAANSSGAMVTATGTSTALVYFGVATTSAATQTPQVGSSVGPNSVAMAVRFSVPIANLSGSTQVFASQCGAGCENVFSWKGSSVGVTSAENVDAINGNGVVTSTSIYTYTFNTSMGLTVAPNCVANANLSALAYGTQIDSVSNTSVAVRVTNDAGAASAQPHIVTCTKQGADYQASRTIVGSFKEVPKVVGINSPKTCFYAFGGASATLTAPTECTSGTCVEVFDSCGTGSPPAWATTARYLGVTLAAGTFANNSFVQCSCTALDTTTASYTECATGFVTSGSTWAATATGGVNVNIIASDIAGTQQTSYVTMKCTGQAP